MPRTKDPEVRRNEILDAALQLFRTHGFEHTSMDTIAAQAGVAKGSLYNYFVSKEAVYQAMIERTSAVLVAQITRLFTRPNTSATRRLHDYLDFTFALGSDRMDSLQRILTDDPVSFEQQIYLQAIDAAITEVLPAFATLIADGARNNEFQILDANFTAAAIMGALRGVHTAYFETLGVDLDLGRAYVDELLARILGSNPDQIGAAR